VARLGKLFEICQVESYQRYDVIDMPSISTVILPCHPRLEEGFEMGFETIDRYAKCRYRTPAYPSTFAYPSHPDSNGVSKLRLRMAMTPLSCSFVYCRFVPLVVLPLLLFVFFSMSLSISTIALGFLQFLFLWCSKRSRSSWGTRYSGGSRGSRYDGGCARFIAALFTF